MFHISSTQMLAANTPGIQQPMCDFLQQLDNEELNTINTTDKQNAEYGSLKGHAFFGLIGRGAAGAYGALKLHEALDLNRRLGHPLTDVLAVSSMTVAGIIGGLVGLLTAKEFLPPRPSDEMIENLSKSGFSALDKIRYGRLQEKITKISARLINGVNGAISDSEKAELKCAKNYFKATSSTLKMAAPLQTVEIRFMGH